MLQLGVYGDAAAMAAVAERLDVLPGMRHVGLAETGRGRGALLTADVRAEAADGVLATLEALHVPADDVALVRLDTIASVSSEPTTLVWAEVRGQARALSRADVRYFVLMAAAGVVAAVAVVNDSPTLIVGAMAISPDLFPITAACAGSSCAGAGSRAMVSASRGWTWPVRCPPASASPTSPPPRRT